ncbi:MAG: type IV pilus modification protein PilV [Acidiferrobacterales bacterium]
MMPNIRMPRAEMPLHSRGFSLLEVLIALLILSVALLGIAALASISLKADDSSYMRTQADNLAYQAIDLMHSDRSDAVNGCFDSTFNAGGTAPSVCGSTAANVALLQWQQALTALPSGVGTISTSAANGVTTVTVVISWNDTRAQNSLLLGAPAYNLSVESAL